MVHGICEEQMEAFDAFDRNGATGTDARLISYIPVSISHCSQFPVQPALPFVSPLAPRRRRRRGRILFFFFENRETRNEKREKGSQTTEYVQSTYRNPHYRLLSYHEVGRLSVMILMEYIYTLIYCAIQSQPARYSPIFHSFWCEAFETTNPPLLPPAGLIPWLG